MSAGSEGCEEESQAAILVVDTLCGPIYLQPCDPVSATRRSFSQATSAAPHSAQPSSLADILPCDCLLAIFHVERSRRIRDVEFCVELEKLSQRLQRPSNDDDDKLQVWSVHRVTPRYVTSAHQLMTQDTQSDDIKVDGYSRGLLVGVARPEAEVNVRRILEGTKFGIDARLQRSTSETGSAHWTTGNGRQLRAVYVGNDVGSDDVITQVHPAFMEQCNNVVMHSLAEVDDILRQLQMLRSSDVSNGSDELLQLLATLAANRTTTDDSSHNDVTISSSSIGDSGADCRLLKFPCVVVEGLDASGKTTIVERLVKHLSAARLYSPPENIHHLRAAFDRQPCTVRRAYYMLGNYLVGHSISQLCQRQTVVLDRFWHSTAAYAIAEEASLPPANHSVYTWPRDLIQPSVVILLVVGEQTRNERMQRRIDATGVEKTQEECKLAADTRQRERVLQAYRSMVEPGVVEVNADGTPEEVFQLVLNVLQQNGILNTH